MEKCKRNAKNKENFLPHECEGTPRPRNGGRDVEALTVVFYIETPYRPCTNCILVFFQLYKSRVDRQGMH